ncbi:CopK family periplasmic copper-binding protein [Polaromonas sp.]|uniref:CopK family periplasmic copper-binding protein n=1 Tax=Polaromonas sp. TaxID=1869339 RepID=UPI0013B6D987|nr:CopK family periplasmic copper-binding protein [Polaromonas sp.]NDP63528.1 CopK family periplasmic copper-binding protein [Polaromonas sp.]
MFKSIKSVALITILVTTAVAASASTQTTASLAAASGFSWNQGNFEKVVSLKDGSSLHEYSDGRMALESSYGRAVSKPVGQVVYAMDGSAITITSNEVARLSKQLRIHP